MACLARLKEDSRFLESLFPQEHGIFQIVSASLDEFTCRFVGRNGEKTTVFHANVTVCNVTMGSMIKEYETQSSNLLYLSTRVRTAPPVSVRVRVSVSFSYGVMLLRILLLNLGLPFPGLPEVYCSDIR